MASSYSLADMPIMAVWALINIELLACKFIPLGCFVWFFYVFLCFGKRFMSDLAKASSIFHLPPICTKKYCNYIKLVLYYLVGNKSLKQLYHQQLKIIERINVMNDVTKPKQNTNKTNDDTATTDKPVGTFAAIGSFFATVFNYGYAGLKVVDVVARIATAAALYLKLNDAILNWGAAFLAATAVWEIVVALLRAYGPNHK